MRNFSKIALVHHFSYTVNNGEYRNQVNTMSILRDLAKAFETPLANVVSDFNTLSRDRGNFAACRCCPSETSVIVDLIDFAYYANSDEDGKSLPLDTQRAFVYVNLNTGAHVIWVHSAI